MDHTSKAKLSNEMKQKLEEKLLNLLSFFRAIKGRPASPESMAHTSSVASPESMAHTIFILSEPDLGALVWDHVGKQLRETEAHKELVNLLLNGGILWQDQPDVALTPSDTHMYQLYLGAVLLRVMSSADAFKEKSKSVLSEFVDFLDLPDVPRRVDVPLFHLDLVRTPLDLGDFGNLTRSDSTPNEIIPEFVQKSFKLSPRIVLSFTIRTGLLLKAIDFPLSEILKAKIGLLRLAVSPLIAYNHFFVEHIQPWELKIVDDDFSGRHWSKSHSISKSVKRHVVTDDDAKRVMSLRESFGGINWETVSSWRLAIDRLDDASFKLECGSPDAILDLVIGLESIFVDRDSRQESTHKVAIRVSRFLEASLANRKEMFRKVKQIYKDRSTLAHGQQWNLDSNAVARVEDAAIILSRVLRKMLELQTADLDHDTLDLA